MVNRSLKNIGNAFLKKIGGLSSSIWNIGGLPPPFSSTLVVCGPLNECIVDLILSIKQLLGGAGAPPRFLRALFSQCNIFSNLGRIYTTLTNIRTCYRDLSNAVWCKRGLTRTGVGLVGLYKYQICLSVVRMSAFLYHVHVCNLATSQPGNRMFIRLNKIALM
jgi:hypothetical protein